MKSHKASQIMTPGVIVANLKSKYSEVMEFFVKHKIHHLPIVNDDKLIGIISTNDMLRYVEGKMNGGKAVNVLVLEQKFSVEEVMTKNPESVAPDTKVEKVLEILSKGEFQAVPVTKGGFVHGIISNKDIIRLFNWEHERN